MAERQDSSFQILNAFPVTPSDSLGGDMRILVINPNSSQVMTQGLCDMITKLRYPESIHIDTLTMPPGVPESINNETDAEISSDAFLLALNSGRIGFPLAKFNGVLVACYSVHPLTAQLAKLLSPDVHVIGIFEASISTALSYLPPPGAYEKFGIVTTGKSWEEALTKGVEDFLGIEAGSESKRFKGVFSTGLTAGELHSLDANEVKSRVKEATKMLVKDGDCRVVCLGCAGMAGMEETVREACIDQLGENDGRKVRVVDGVKAGIAMLQGLARS